MCAPGGAGVCHRFGGREFFNGGGLSLGSPWDVFISTGDGGVGVPRGAARAGRYKHHPSSISLENGSD